MSKVEAVILNTKPFRPTDYNEKAMTAVIDESYLICDVKKDGVRLNLCVLGDSVEWLSREGKRFPALARTMPLNGDERWKRFFNPNLGEGLFAKGFMLDAELIILDPLGTEFPCKTTSGTLRRKEHDLPLSRLRVYVFDILPMAEVMMGGDCETMLSVRKGWVEYQVACLKKEFPEIDWRVAESYEVYSMDTLPVIEREMTDDDGNETVVKLQPPLSLTQLYNAVRERGEEGLVCKDPMGSYRRSKVSGWWKMVPDDNEDGVVEDVIWGTEGLANEGKVIGFKVLLESGHVVNACKISRALMDEFTDTEKRLPGYFKGHTARVTFMERYPDGSLRHPSFDCFRGISDPLIKE
uniref:DNA ligase n=1 Tax=Pseudomonas phage Ghuch01 TaxID=3138535 RepID=A0AAU6W372_9CAUD